eukprot:6491422-Amphidinium_carterae.1
MSYAFMYMPLTRDEAMAQKIQLLERCCACHREDGLVQCARKDCTHRACPLHVCRLFDNHYICFCCDQYSRCDELHPYSPRDVIRNCAAPRQVMDRWKREHAGRVRKILMTFAPEQSGLSAWVLHDDEPDMSVDETRGCDHCRQHHVNLNACNRKGCRRQQCDVHLYGESPFAEYLECLFQRISAIKFFRAISDMTSADFERSMTDASEDLRRSQSLEPFPLAPKATSPRRRRSTPMPRSPLDRKNDWWIRVSHDAPRKLTLDIRAIQNQYIIREDADVWVEGIMNKSEFPMSYKRTTDPHEFSSFWTGFTYVKLTQGEIPIVPGGDPYAM